MATLRDLASGRAHPVPARLLIGRAPTCGLVLDVPTVSGEHASLMWSQGGWEIRDLGSRNGTFVDGSRLASGEGLQVAVGARLSFGVEEGGWELIEDGAPSALAQHQSTGALRMADDGILALPDSQQPELTIFMNAQGLWRFERVDAASGPISDGEVVDVAGGRWTIRLPVSIEGTAAVDTGPRLDTISLRFEVSRDEEHTTITTVHRGVETRLEEREHGYVLLTLARARLADREHPAAEQGWIDRERLLKMLAMDANALNVAIYRARGQLAAAGVDGAAGVVEVRRGQRRLGVDPSRLEVRLAGS